MMLVRECPLLTKNCFPVQFLGSVKLSRGLGEKMVEQTKGVMTGQVCFWQKAVIAQGRGLSGLEAATVPALEGRTVLQ